LSAPRPGPGRLVQRGAGLLAVEAALLTALGLFNVVAVLRSTPASGSGDQVERGAALGFAAATLLTGLVVALLARAVLRRCGWARTPALVVQLVALPVGADQVLSQVWLTGSLVLLLAGATTYHLLAAAADLRPPDPG